MTNQEIRQIKQNFATYDLWFDHLMMLAVSSVKWKLPPTVDQMYLERELFYNGQVIFFIADSSLVCLSGFGKSKPNLYGIPLLRQINAKNGFTAQLDNTNSVICYNNVLRKPSAPAASDYALRLAKLDRIIDLNTEAQKTPYIIRADKNNVLSVTNAYAKLENGEPLIAITEDFKPDALQVFNMNPSFAAPQIRALQESILGEYMRTRGIGSANTDKAERLITSEVAASNAGLLIYQEAIMKPRLQACAEINARFGAYIDEPVSVGFAKDVMDLVINGLNNSVRAAAPEGEMTDG